MITSDEPTLATVHAAHALLAEEFPELWQRLVRREANFYANRSDPVANEIHRLLVENLSLQDVQATDAVFELRRLAAIEAGVPLQPGAVDAG